MHFNYGVAFMEMRTGLENHAIEAFKTATRLRPSRSESHSQLGLAYVSANRREEAIESYKQSLILVVMSRILDNSDENAKFHYFIRGCEAANHGRLTLSKCSKRLPSSKKKADG